MDDTKSNKFGLSRTTNIIIVALGMISASQSCNYAIAAISIIAVIGATYRFILDYRKGT